MADFPGTPGDDVINGTSGDDTISGGLGADVIFAGAGGDSVSGGAGRDTLVGDEGNDSLDGGTDGDTLVGGSGNDVLDGGTGDDTYRFGVVFGNDTIAASEALGRGNVIAFDAGIAPADVVVSIGGYNGDLTIALGSDRIVINAYLANLLNAGGGGGFGTIRFADGTVIDLTADPRPVAIGGTDADDVLLGTDWDDAISAGDGHDDVDAADGADTVLGGDGADTIYGNFGDDLLRGEGGDDELIGDDGNDTLDGGAGDDLLTGSDGNDTFVLEAGSGHDTVTGSDLIETDNIVQFGAGIARDDIALSVSGRNGDLTIAVGADSFLVPFYLVNRSFGGGFGELRLDDGTVVAVDGDALSTATLTLGTSLIASIDQADGHDVIAVDLGAGITYDFRLHGFGLDELARPKVLIRDDALSVVPNGGNVVNPWDGANTDDPRFAFTPTTDGTYYLDIGGGNRSDTGRYMLTAVERNPAGMVFTSDEIAWQLIHNYNDWFSGQRGAFTIGPDGALTYNVAALDDPGKALARAALKMWGDVTGITFVERTTAAEITFDDFDPVSTTTAYTRTTITGNEISTAKVVVTAGFMAAFGSTVGSYSFETFVHEIGHALGLGHGGNYNDSASYPTDAYYLNDSVANSIMSYFQAAGDDLTAAGTRNIFVDADFRVMLSPAVADIIAVQELYGADTSTRLRDTTYGYHSNTGNAVLDAAVMIGADMFMTIYDDGGTDTLDFSGAAVAQFINLSDETSSNVLGGRMNLSIARDVVIEQAVGGTAGDLILGNLSQNRLVGGGGNDSLYGSLGDDDLAAGDGNDVLNAGFGDDRAAGGTGNDRVHGGAGDDQLSGNDGRDRIAGNDGDDTLDGGAGDDVLAGLDGSDRLSGAADADVLSGGAGDDTLSGGDDADALYGHAGNDQLSGDAGGDVLNGGVGNDAADGGLGDDRLAGGPGDDTLGGGGGADTVIGGAGFDVVALGQGDGVATIIGFLRGADRLALDGLVFGDLVFSGHTVAVEVGGVLDELAVFSAVWQAARLTEADFV